MTMREKIARAMCVAWSASATTRIRKAEPSYVSSGWKCWDDMPPMCRQDWLAAADAALDALMEPTEEMQLAYNEIARSAVDCPLNRWQAMINAAKEER